MKLKAKAKNGIVKAKVMMKHDMITYDQAKKKGVKPNFITYVTASVDGKIVYEVSTSQFLSKNPILKYKFRGEKGKKITMTWKDLLGNTKSSTKKIK